MGTAQPDLTTALAGTGPAEPVPVALLARTSTLGLQDPLASLSRQVRSCQAWLPLGWYITGYYWDIESGGLDLEDRSQGDAYRAFADAGIPRDGGLADLLTEAQAPLPRFAAVVCEDIERSARDTFNALKLEKELSRQGIPLFATDEPASIEGINATTVLVRRVKQGVAEWFRLQLKEKAWKGLQEHSLAGWNIGPAPYGYLAERVPHPAPAKAAQGRTKSRLILDPARAPVVAQIFAWRVIYHLSIPAITARLNADRTAYPSVDPNGWAITTVNAVLANPKYTGHMVYGRTRITGTAKRARAVPPDQWIWSLEPTHPAIVDRAIWDQAQTEGARRGNIRNEETATSTPGRRYILRSRIRCRICNRRMCGIWRPTHDGSTIVYYKCPHNPASPRHAAAHPDHGPVSLREDTMLDALAQFFDTYLFGPDRARHLAATLPATAADHADTLARQAAWLQTQLTRIDAAERGLIAELEAPADPGNPAALAFRARIRERYAELFKERTAIETQLKALQAETPHDNDLALIDLLPIAAHVLPGAPDKIKTLLLDAFDIQAIYRKDMHQVTIYATLTDATPDTVKLLLEDPRTDSDVRLGNLIPAQEQISNLKQGPMVPKIFPGARILPTDVNTEVNGASVAAAMAARPARSAVHQRRLALHIVSAPR